MASQQSSGSGKNGSAKCATNPDLKSILQQYLDGVGSYLDEHEVRKEDSTDSNAASSLTDIWNCEERPQLQYNGQCHTTTGVVRIMRENGNVESADLLEELRQTQESARLLLNQLQALHKRKTGAYHRVPKKTTQSGS